MDSHLAQEIYDQMRAKTPMCCPPDCLLRGQEFPGPSLWVWQRLLRFPHLLEPLQLHPGGERGLGGVWEAQLHGLPVCPDQGRVPRVPALDGPQRPPQLLQDDPLCKSAIAGNLICWDYSSLTSFLECAGHEKLRSCTNVTLSETEGLDFYQLSIQKLAELMKATVSAGESKTEWSTHQRGHAMVLMLPLTAGRCQCNPIPGSVHLYHRAFVQPTHSLQADSNKNQSS